MTMTHANIDVTRIYNPLYRGDILSLLDCMNHHHIYTFRGTHYMDHYIQQLTEERNLDCSSLIRLSLYHMSSLLNRHDVRSMGLYELVDYLESQAPERFPTFADFCDTSLPTAGETAAPEPKKKRGAHRRKTKRP